MSPADTIALIVEASLALAGFAGIITVLARREGSARSALVRLDLVNLLSTSLGALFFCLLALVLLMAETPEQVVWQVGCYSFVRLLLASV